MEHTRDTRIEGRVEDTYTLANGMEVNHIWYLNYWTAKKYSPTHNGVVYVSGEAEPEGEWNLESTRKGDDPEMDALWRKFNREEVRLMREVIARATEAEDFNELPEIVREALTGKLRFSRRAGCSCPCSPGFLGANRDILGKGGSVRVSTPEYIAHWNQVASERKEAALAAAN